MEITETKLEETPSECDEENSELDTTNPVSIIEELKTSLIDRAAEIEVLHSIAIEQENKYQDQVNTLQAKVEELHAALEAANRAKEEAVEELNKFKSDQLFEKRMSLLQDKNLVRSTEEARNKQAEKIKAMSDEEFASYVEELSDLSNQFANLAVEKKSEEAMESSEVEDNSSAESEINSTTDQLKEVLDEIAADIEDSKEEKETTPSKESASAQKSLLDPSILREGFVKMLKTNKQRGI